MREFVAVGTAFAVLIGVLSNILMLGWYVGGIRLHSQDQDKAIACLAGQRDTAACNKLLAGYIVKYQGVAIP